MRTPLDVHDFILQVQALETLDEGFFPPVPQFRTPVGRTSQKYVTPKWVASHFVNRTLMTHITLQVLLLVRLAASVKRVFLSTSQIQARLILDKVKGKPCCQSEVHSLVLIILRLGILSL